MLRVQFPHSAQDWNVLAARGVLFAGAIDTAATYTGHVSPKIGAALGGAAGLILACSKAVQSASGILRPVPPTVSEKIEKAEVPDPNH